MSHKLKDHIVVCGYKDDMSQLLLHVLDFNPGLPAEKLVLMAHLSDETIASFRAHPRLKNIQVAPGDYAQELQLRRVMPHLAKKILLLADRAPLANGTLPSVKETDARTLMAAMVLSHVARGVPVSAEILDPSMDSYLRMAGVSEIIHSREYNRLLLANASGSAGLSSIIFSLLDPHNPTVIHVEEIPESLVGRTYGELQAHLAGYKRRSVLIGVLQNTGNSHRVKEAALRKAQLTSNVEDLVRNLKAVKQMQFNCPVFNPAADYRLTEGSTAILIETRASEQEMAA